MDRKRQLHRKFVDYYSRSFGFARIIFRFPVKLPVSGLYWVAESLDIQTHTFRWCPRPAFHHLRMCQHVFALYSALTTALDSDERRLEATYVREKSLRSGERLN